MMLKMYSSSSHSRCRLVCFFIRTDLEKLSITSLAPQWILCSEWVPSEWESKQLIYNPQEFIKSCEVKNWVFVRNKSIEICFRFNIAFFNEKVAWIRREICTEQALFTRQKQSKVVLNQYTRDGLFHWRKRYYGLWTVILARSDVYS